jgi:hypothetical protein
LNCILHTIRDDRDVLGTHERVIGSKDKQEAGRSFGLLAAVLAALDVGGGARQSLGHTERCGRVRTRPQF